MQQKLKIDYYYDPATKIFYKHYFGEIYLEDVLSSWEHILNKNKIPKNTKKFILDYRKGTLIATPEAAGHIADMYENHETIFGGARVAMIMDRPDQVIFPLLVNMEQSIVEFKPFFSLESAIGWLDDY